MTTPTIIFTLLLLVTLLVSWRKSASLQFSPQLTTELKGLAILAILLGHIGYFLVPEQQFLYPWSTISGVGVDLFLFLSGFGLTLSQLARPLTPVQFYLKRLKRLFLPMWLAIAIFYLADLLVLRHGYDLTTLIQSAVGFFPQADIHLQVDSPLWYFSLIFFYYLIFPWSFRFPWLAAPIVLVASKLVLALPLPVTIDVLKLYQLHLWAFPLGILLGLSKHYHWWPDLSKFLPGAVRLVLAAGLLWLVSYTAINSAVNGPPNLTQAISLITMVSLILLGLLKSFRFQFLILLGEYSYEIYLLHWPLMSRYDLLYRFLPLPVATYLYLFVLLGLGWLLRQISERLNRV